MLHRSTLGTTLGTKEQRREVSDCRCETSDCMLRVISRYLRCSTFRSTFQRRMWGRTVVAIWWIWLARPPFSIPSLLLSPFLLFLLLLFVYLLKFLFISFPPEDPNFSSHLPPVQSSVFFRLHRAAFMEYLKGKHDNAKFPPLSSDAYSLWSNRVDAAVHNLNAKNATVYLLETRVSELVSFLQTAKDQTQNLGQVFFPLRDFFLRAHSHTNFGRFCSAGAFQCVTWDWCVLVSEPRRRPSPTPLTQTLSANCWFE